MFQLLSQYTNRIIKNQYAKYSNLVALGHDNVGNPEDEVEHEQDHHHQDVPQLVPNLRWIQYLVRPPRLNKPCWFAQIKLFVDIVRWYCSLIIFCLKISNKLVVTMGTWFEVRNAFVCEAILFVVAAGWPRAAFSSLFFSPWWWWWWWWRWWWSAAISIMTMIATLSQRMMVAMMVFVARCTFAGIFFPN